MSVPISRLRVSVVDAQGRPADAPGLARWLARTAPAATAGEVSIALVSDARIRALNRTYRKKDYATDVLSFPTEPHVARRRSPVAQRTLHVGPGALHVAGTPVSVHLGDIAIARGVAARQAREAGHSLPTELRILALHGLLHLLGYDHERDRGEMRRLERRLRRKGGLRDSLIERASTPRRH